MTQQTKMSLTIFVMLDEHNQNSCQNLLAKPLVQDETVNHVNFM